MQVDQAGEELALTMRSSTPGDAHNGDYIACLATCLPGSLPACFSCCRQPPPEVEKPAGGQAGGQAAGNGASLYKREGETPMLRNFPCPSYHAGNVSSCPDGVPSSASPPLRLPQPQACHQQQHHHALITALTPTRAPGRCPSPLAPPNHTHTAQRPSRTHTHHVGPH